MGMVRKTLDEAAARGQIDEVKADALTEADIARFNAEDGFDPEDTLKGFRRIDGPAEVRARIGMSQDAFAEALRIPLATLRNWEQGRVGLDPVVRAFLALVADNPENALEVLGGTARSRGSGPGQPHDG